MEEDYFKYISERIDITDILIDYYNSNISIEQVSLMMIDKGLISFRVFKKKKNIENLL